MLPTQFPLIQNQSLLCIVDVVEIPSLSKLKECLEQRDKKGVKEFLFLKTIEMVLFWPGAISVAQKSISNESS